MSQRQSSGASSKQQAVADEITAELPQSTRVVILLGSNLSPSRSELLKWKPANGAGVGGVCMVERSTPMTDSVHLHALTSREERDLALFENVGEVYEWAREELLSAFEGKTDFLICDQLGPEIVLGEGLDSAVRTVVWKEEEDERDDEVEKMLLVLVVSEDSLVEYVKDVYKLSSERTVMHRGSFSSFKARAEAWYDKHHNRFLLRRRRRREIQEPPTSFSTDFPTDEVSGHFYGAVRFPLLIGVLLLIALELLLYTGLLQIVVVYERATRAHRSTRKSLELATHEKTWRRCARKLDNLEGKPGGSLPELSLAKNFATRLERAIGQIETGEVEKGREEIIRCLFEITAPDAVHTLLPESLYTQNHTGRNQEACKFVELVEKAVAFIANSLLPSPSALNADTSRISPRSVAVRRNSTTIPPGVFGSSEEELDFRCEEEKKKVLSELARAYGSTALCLSGGACNAFFHLGVIRTLLERGILPKHISGASGGALVGSFVATHTDEELMLLLNNPSQLSKIFDPCSGAGWPTLAKNLLTRLTIFDAKEWANKLQAKVCGTLTFQEAFLRTGRSLTIMAFNGVRHTRALNHKTAPDVCIFSAVLASSAIPKLLPAIELLRKTKSGEIVPFLAWGRFWRDGSFEEELPFEALGRVFNASFTVVSQVNPHIVPFFYDNRGTAGRAVEHLGGRGWRGGFVSSFLERVLKQDMKKWLQIMDEFRLLPPIFETDFSRLFLGQNFGSVTLVPPVRFRDYLNLVSDPSTARKMNHYLITGSRMTFPKLAMIEDRMRVELALERVLQTVTARMIDKGRSVRIRNHSSTGASLGPEHEGSVTL
jgi:predicted acylesterase/phospholipase RssA